MLVCIYCQAYTTNIVSTYIHHIQVWKIEEATEEIKAKVKQTWIYITVYMCTTTVLGFTATVTYIVPTPRDKDLIFLFKIIELYFPQWEHFIVWCIKAMIFVMIYMAISTPGFTILYYNGHLNLQKLMLKHCLRNINTKYAHLEYISLSNVEYHQEIENELMFCVKRHVQFTE